jgi:hypothetical protein
MKELPEPGVKKKATMKVAKKKAAAKKKKAAGRAKGRG